IFKASIDDDVKVLVVRGVGDHLGTGADLDELMAKRKGGVAMQEEFGIEDGEDVTMPGQHNYRNGASLVHWYADPRSGNRSLADFKKISILEVKGYCYGWHFYQAADADLVISSDDALFGHPAFRYVGYAPRMWQWAVMMGLRKFQEMVFTGRPFSAQEMYDCNFVNSVVPRDQLEAEVEKYALACAYTRPTDTVFMQKVFFNIMRQHQGEYMGSMLSAWMESMTGALKEDVDNTEAGLGGKVMDQGVNNLVKNNDNRFPPEWRLSRSGRDAPGPE
ncbi:MAG TPA: enoyl-CoA hydratase/isomerase family protein, partial [Mycobacteriales bacterium]|nr:enoyl-CoA hydratase/isomerase family protein [Mycobacteriales bacterium]